MAFDVRRFDIYRKIPKDLTQPTLTGAVISVCCCCFIAILFLSEFLSFISTEISSELFVDNPSSKDKIVVHINISLPRLTCDVVGLDIQDDMGRHEVGFVENTEKFPLNEGKGCRFEGKFYINKVPGNFHVSTHSAKSQPDDVDMAHSIHQVTFGSQMKDGTPGTFNALKNVIKDKVQSIESHDYVMKIVPTIYESLHGEKTETYQYTYAYKSYVSMTMSGKIIPAIWFRYDLNPITVKYTEKRQPLYSFLTTVCAIVGGTFTVAGLIDSFIFSASEILKKHQMGKLN